MSAATIAIIVVVAVVVLVISAMAMTRRRLKHRFGPEYDRVVGEKRSQFRAAAELTRRERRVQRLRIHPLTATARAAFAAEWRTIQEGFVDQPQHAVVKGEELLALVMKERGYPAEDADQIMADLSVAHADMLDQYRAARQTSAAADRGDASTEDLRQALIHLRAVFGEVLGKPGADQPTAALPKSGQSRGFAEPGPRVADGAGPQVADGAGPQVARRGEPRLPEDDEVPNAAGATPDGVRASEPSDGAAAAEPEEQLWRPVRVPPARSSEEDEAAQ